MNKSTGTTCSYQVPAENVRRPAVDMTGVNVSVQEWIKFVMRRSLWTSVSFLCFIFFRLCIKPGPILFITALQWLLDKWRADKMPQGLGIWCG